MSGTLDNRPEAALSRPARLDALLRTRLDAVADPALDRFAAMVRTVLNVPVALVSLVSADRQFFPGACGLGQPWADRRQTPLSHSFCQHVVATAEPLVIVDARADPRVRGNLAIEELGVVGYAGMPLTDATGEVLGSLCAIDTSPREWTDAEVRLLSDLAASCSDSLRLRISNHRTELEFERSRLLLRASTMLAGASTVDEVVDAVRDLVTGTLDPAYVGFSLLDGRDALTLASTRLLPGAVADRWGRYTTLHTTPSALAARTGEAVLLPDRATVGAVTPDAAATFDEMGWQSAASLPLVDGTGSIGALTFVWKEPHTVDEAERAVLAVLAGYVAQTVTRVRLLDDRRTAAATMQKALLTTLPEHAHLRLAARYLPAHHEDHVGGDWYDAISVGDRLALVIGDVAGHSITAAAKMSEYRSMLRTLLVDRHEPPSALLRRLEQTGRDLGVDAIATVLLAYLDPAPGGGHTLTWSNAGHPPPSLLLGDGEVVALSGRDPLLHAARRVSRHDFTSHLPDGSVLLLHTDGLVETRTATFDEGMTRLHRVLERHAGTTPERLADLVLEEATATGEDDVALLVVGMPGGPPG